MKNIRRNELNGLYATERKLHKELANPMRADEDIIHAINEGKGRIQDLLREDLEAQGMEYDPNGPLLDECEYCGRAIQFITDHECAGTRAESAELRRNDDYAEF